MKFSISFSRLTRNIFVVAIVWCVWNSHYWESSIGAQESPSKEVIEFFKKHALPRREGTSENAETTEIEDLDGQNSAEIASENTSKPRRYALIFSLTHRYDYLNDDEKKDDTYIPTYGSMTACYAAVCESNFFDLVVVLDGKRLTKENVYALFDHLAKDSKEGDEVFIYWNGHGSSELPDESGDEEDGVDECLCLYETTKMRFNGDWAKSLRKTALVDDEIGKLFRSLPGRKITAIFETCHSGGLATAPERTTGSTRSISMEPGEKIRAENLADFAAKSIVEIEKNGRENQRKLDSELNKVGDRYKSELSYGDSMRSRTSRPAVSRSRVGVRLTDDSDDGNCWFITRPSSETRSLGEHGDEASRDIDFDGSYNLFFAAQEDESAYGYTWVRNNAEQTTDVSINPVLLAYILCLRNAEERGVPLRFEDFVNVACEVVKINLSIVRSDPRYANAKQSPLYYVNLPDVLMYAPRL